MSTDVLCGACDQVLGLTYLGDSRSSAGGGSRSHVCDDARLAEITAIVEEAARPATIAVLMFLLAPTSFVEALEQRQVQAYDSDPHEGLEGSASVACRG